jgi:hypothetical protein
VKNMIRGSNTFTAQTISLFSVESASRKIILMRGVLLLTSMRSKR